MKQKKKHQTKILLTGGAGFLGKHVYKELIKKGYSKNQITVPRSKELDLRVRDNCSKVTKRIDIVIHMAANVGGIGKNLRLPGEMFFDNSVMALELMEAARKNQVGKFVSVGSVCAYPKFAQVPFKEESLWDGYPDETNAPFGIAKKILLVQGQTYRSQYGFNAIHLLPVNLYGEGDNFGNRTSHVIPALIRRVVEAKQKNTASVSVWGSGNQTREFLYAGDAARAIVLATEKYNKGEPVNISGGKEVKIKELIAQICRLMNYQGKIKWDTRKPDGQPRRKIDGTRALKEFGFKPRMSLEKGLRKTIDWYLKNKD